MSKMYRVRFTKEVYVKANSNQHAISKAIEIRETIEFDDMVEVANIT